nr:MAG TPA: hypothetical protein [Caudoviricetes sp.]
MDYTQKKFFSGHFFIKDKKRSLIFDFFYDFVYLIVLFYS